MRSSTFHLIMQLLQHSSLNSCPAILLLLWYSVTMSVFSVLRWKSFLLWQWHKWMIHGKQNCQKI